MGKLTVTVKALEGPRARTFEVKGRQTARALLALVEAGEDGVTALEVSGWAYRFAAYCWELRHRHGLEIVTMAEKHSGGWHGRHVLRTPVEIISIDGAIAS